MAERTRDRQGAKADDQATVGLHRVAQEQRIGLVDGPLRQEETQPKAARTTSRELRRSPAGTIEPLRVVDRNDGRRLIRQGRQDARRGDADDVGIDLSVDRVRAQDRRLQRLALWPRKVAEPISVRAQQVTQGGVRVRHVRARGRLIRTRRPCPSAASAVAVRNVVPTMPGSPWMTSATTSSRSASRNRSLMARSVVRPRNLSSSTLTCSRGHARDAASVGRWSRA